ncbi:MAG: sulfatase [Planctomycetota bacterium]
MNRTPLSRTIFASVAAMGTSLAAAAQPASHAADNPDAPRNVVVIIGDDIGLQLGTYGDPDAITPAVDRLAAEGTRFDRAYATAATCSASRASLLTGLHAHASGQYGHSHTVGRFHTYASVQSLPRILKDNGYRTAVFGKLHVSPLDVYPFDRWEKGSDLPGGSRNTVAMAGTAAEWWTQRPDEPFFLYFATYDAHDGRPGHLGNGEGIAANSAISPYPGVEAVSFEPSEMTVPPWLNDTAGVRNRMANYHRSINRFDQGVARLVERLKQTGQYDNTLILVTSDHGPPMQGAKTTLYETGARVPLVVRHPESQRRGVASSALVTLVDVVPTVLNYARIDPPVVRPVVPFANDEKPWSNPPPRPYQFHGRSFLDVLEQEHPAGWDEAFLAHTFHEVRMYDPMRVVVRDRWKFIYNLDFMTPQTWAIKTFRTDRPLDQQFVGVRPLEPFLLRPQYQLFDLENDPWETNNLADDPAHADRVAEMLEATLRHMDRTADHFPLGEDTMRKMRAYDAARSAAQSQTPGPASPITR